MGLLSELGCAGAHERRYPRPMEDEYTRRQRELSRHRSEETRAWLRLGIDLVVLALAVTLGCAVVIELAGGQHDAGTYVRAGIALSLAAIVVYRRIAHP
ncbi:hypothetical protein PP504_gp35 [Gordonia phage Dolores]|uniref:Uncharacterized protein n=1 Tax=Gordonia phage Dolores TaxID=2873534 RepID=A0AAE9BLS9_9CAUD|nr:hypothetical protein PP504_gp35 [Gordonia phage Dolores]UAJ16466.1 hypothetical protein SEA_DOLORES_35 [Gordonia phage Dolores]URM87976.1 hypothetical protein SEA_WINKNICK_36 [Gordonia phage WinkNick]